MRSEAGDATVDLDFCRDARCATRNGRRETAEYASLAPAAESENAGQLSECVIRVYQFSAFCQSRGVATFTQ